MEMSSTGTIVLAGYYHAQHVLHFQCYAEPENNSSNHAAADCCNSILRAQSRIQAIITTTDKEDEVDAVGQDYPMLGGVGSILADVSIIDCEHNLVHLPHPPPSLIRSHRWLSAVFPQQPGLSLSLVGMLTHTPNKTVARNLESDPDPCASANVGVVDQQVVQWCSWRWFLWNDTANAGDWITTAKEATPISSSGGIMNAAWVSTRTKDNSNQHISTPDHAAAEPAQNQSGNSEDASSFIHLSSTLSKSGGMHRELRQRLTFSLPKSSIDLMTSSGEAAAAAASIVRFQQYDYSIDILLSLPSGLFINVEDASFTTVPGMKIVVSSISSSTSSRSGGGLQGHEDTSMIRTNATSTDTAIIIDQEEPAFTSPSHLVLCRLTGSLASAPVVSHESNGGQGPDSSLIPTTIELTWDTHLHVRYPLPIQNNNNNEQAWRHDEFSQITFMPPIIAAGEIFNPETRHSYSLAASADTAIAPFWMLPRQAPPPTLWVAAGHQDDFMPVFLLTLLAALLGTVVLLRDMMFLFTARDDASSSSSLSTLSDKHLQTKKDK
jgi:hypothetical protein